MVCHVRHIKLRLISLTDHHHNIPFCLVFCILDAVNIQDEQISDEILNSAEENFKYCENDSQPESEEVTFHGFCNYSKKYFKGLSCIFTVFFDLSGLFDSYKFVLTIPCQTHH